MTEENGLERTETDEIKNLKRQLQGTKQWMKAPDGTQANLTESQWLQVRTESFKKWFGDWELAALLNNAKKAWNDKGFTFTYRFSPSIELKQRLEDLLGHTVNILQIDGSTVRHIKNEHSDIKSETKKGQKARTAEDIVLIPYLLNNFDEAELSQKHDDNLGNRAITIKKQINGVSVIGTIERGKNGVYVVTNWQTVSAVQMQTTPGRNALSDADKSKIQQDIAKIKTGAENFSKIVDENGDEYVGLSLDDTAQQREAAEEYIAHIAQKGVPKPNWWKEFLQQIRMFFRKFKWADDAVMLDSQIETVLARAAKKVQGARGKVKGAVVKQNLTTENRVRFSETDENTKEQAKTVVVPPLPVDISDTDSVRNYLFEHFKGKEVEIKADGRLVLFTPRGLKATLKRRGEHRRSFSALDVVVEESYPVGYETVDDLHKAKRPDLRGQFVYAALLDFGQAEKYIATIKLDDTAADERAYFKDISIKKGALFARQTQNLTSENATLPGAPDVTIQQLTDFVKSDFADSPLFTDKMPQKINSKHNIPQNLKNASGDLSDVSDNPDGLRFSLEEYSESDQNDIVAVLRPFVGKNIDMEPEKYRNYLKQNGIILPDQDADLFFRLAVMENSKAARERGIRARKSWIYENFPLFAEVAEFAGGSDFKIKPVGHEGEDFTGSFISPEYVKYSIKNPQGKRSDKQYKNYIDFRASKLSSAPGFPIDEVASAVARKLGQDPDAVKEQILDFFRHLKKKDLYAEYSQFKKDALTLDKEAERQAREEFMQQERFRIEDEAIQILTAGEALEREWIAENPKVFKEIYKRIFDGKEPASTVSNIDIEAVNAALTQDQSTESFGPGYKEGKRAAEKEFREKLKQEREKAYEEYQDKLQLSIISGIATTNFSIV